ncbi:TDP-N-acetylfucosamine:lipid II N-acetylfucosaminyltransferase [Enterobacter sp. R1(2018)]|uniref:TDP-N-acetylfucosamine:lipid II N-acetylfucosaminyltransferase n=1 Tax=Enterobacter sp. R1(2018) TaxID=2447891 RepID=UPI000EB1D974|nr:TDP-N-acetylfucosamine:lipid II N-acetylfucosaminyltransferase [Enterobacter sp. R1(2018)]RKQ40369.1 hypothetical protein D8M09_07110 [Enterobacter sp. R1(2018)]
MNDFNTLHIVPDDKFSNMVHRDFESFSENNKYVVLGKVKKYKYIKDWFPENIKKQSLCKYIINNNIKVVIFHSLLDKFMVTKLPKNLIIVWCGWGYDYYPYLMSGLYPHGMVLTKTKAILNANSKIKNNSLIGFLTGAYRVGRRKLLNLFYPPQKVIKNIDFFIPIISSEFKIIKEMNPWFTCNYASWNYGTIEDDYSIDYSEYSAGENILVGNSATPENNHIEAFNYILENINWQQCKIYCPLSYGNAEYGIKICNYGKKLFGENFIPLLDFMDKKKYNKILASCKLFIFNHIRQQALGNIISGLAMEKTIILNKINPLCSWLEENNIMFITADNTLPLKTLSNDDLINNKKQIEKIWSRSAIAAKTSRLNELLHEAAMQKN